MSTTVNYMLQRPMPEPEGPPGRCTPRAPDGSPQRDPPRSTGRGRAPSREGPRRTESSKSGASGYEVMMKAVFEVGKGTHVELQAGALRTDGKRTPAAVGQRHWQQVADVIVSTNHTIS